MREMGSILLLSLALSCRESALMSSRADQGRPEPVLFLELASDAMESFRAKNGFYPTEWYRLDLAFANRPFHSDERDVHPGKEIGNRWRPPDCKFEYEIRAADKDRFEILARNEKGVPVYEIRQGMEEPRKILAEPGDDLCSVERPRGKILPEAVMFLNAAAASFARYRSIHGEYPKAWKDLNFHWALTPHRPSDAAARPPDGALRSWKPMGSAYSYDIERADRDFYAIRSRNEKGLPDFRITSADRSPVPVP